MSQVETEEAGVASTPESGEMYKAGRLKEMFHQLDDFLNSFELVLKAKSNEESQKGLKLLLDTIRSFIPMERDNNDESRSGGSNCEDSMVPVSRQSFTSNPAQCSQKCNYEKLCKVQSAIKKLVDSHHLVYEDDEGSSTCLFLQNIKFILEIDENQKKNRASSISCSINCSKGLSVPESPPEDETNDPDLGHISKKKKQVTVENENAILEGQGQSGQKIGEKSPLMNDLILKEVFHHLDDYYDLLNCRLVCHHWNAVVLSITRADWEMEFIYNESKKTYLNRWSGKSDDSSISKFVDILNSGVKLSPTWPFPISFFCFTHGDLACPDLISFFRDHGQSVQRLRLNLQNPPHDEDEPPRIPDVTRYTIRQTLMCTTHLTHLILSSTPSWWSEHDDSLDPHHDSYCSSDELFPEPRGTVTLPSISVLDLGSYVGDLRMIADLLEAAATPNLKVVHGFDIRYWDLKYLDNTKKILASCIKSLRYCPNCPERNLEQYEDLAKHDPRPCVLTFEVNHRLTSPVGHIDLLVSLVGTPEEKQVEKDKLMAERISIWLRVAETLQAFLRAGKDSIRSLIIQPCGFLTKTSTALFPVMTQVTTLHLTDWLLSLDKPDRVTYYSGVWPQGGPNLSQVFPTLETVRMRLASDRKDDDQEDDEEDENEVVPIELDEDNNNANNNRAKGPFLNFSKQIQSPCLTVKYLTLEVECPKILKKVAMLFPNVSQLTLEVRPDKVNFPNMMIALWSSCFIGQVTQLEIRMSEVAKTEICCASLDAGFTGFPREFCERLRKNSRNVTMEEAEEKRTNPSILDAKSLQCLTIMFSVSYFDLSKVTFPNPLLSHVTGIYGLDAVRKKNPEFWVDIVAAGEETMGKALDLISPYVDEFTLEDDPNPFFSTSDDD